MELLDLARNKLTELKPNMFEGLDYLQKLYVDSNELTVIRAGAFKGLSTLEKAYFR